MGYMIPTLTGGRHVAVNKGNATGRKRVGVAFWLSPFALSSDLPNGPGSRTRPGDEGCRL